MTQKTNRLYKSRLFVMIFEEKKKLLELYNAVSGKHYEDPELLEINTLDNAIYMSMKNDISFLIDARLALYEHQSTYSPNLPLRFFLYLADLYSDMIRNVNLYSSKKVQLPTPHFVVFYNGERKQPDRKILKLSDLYSVVEKEYKLNLEVLMLNINSGHNPELMEACHTLWEYAEYTNRVRTYAKEMALDKAVEQAVTECIQEGNLIEFLEKNKAEAMKVSIYEYDEERHIRQEREEAWEEGREAVLQSQIRKKLEKGKSLREIADELETEEGEIRRLIESIEQAEEE